MGALLGLIVPFSDADDLFVRVYALIPAALLLGPVAWTFIRRIAPQATDESSAAAEYTARFMIRLAFTEMPILLGFVLAYLGSGAAIRFWFAFAVGALPLAIAGPYNRGLDDYQSRLINAGRSIDIRSALESPR